MYHLPCALLLGAPLLLAADVPGVSEEAEDVLRIYDVRSLSLDTDWVSGTDERSLLPTVVSFGSDRDWELFEPGGEVVEALDVVLELFAEEFEYEGRFVDLSDSGRLIVRGPESLHERLARLLTLLEAAFNAEIVLAVDTVVLDGPAPQGAVIDAVAAESWLASLDGSADRRSHEVRLRTDRPSRLDVGSVEYAIVDYDVEIAQGVAIQDPLLSAVYTGTRLEVAGAPGVGGTFLALLLGRTDRLAAPPMEVETRWMAGSEEGGLSVERDALRRDDLRLMTRSHALTTFLPAGKALVLSSEIDVTGGSKREVVLVRQVGGTLPIRHELPLSASGAQLILADLGAIGPPGVASSGSLFSRECTALDLPFHHDSILVSSFQHLGPAPWPLSSDVFLATDLIDVATGQEHAALDQRGRFLMSTPYFLDASAGEAGLREEQERFVETFDALLASEELYDVEVTVHSSGSAPVRTRMPLRAGKGAATVLGLESVEVYDYDVEVAQSVAIADTQMRTLFDGLCLWLEATPTQGDGLMLELHGGPSLAAPQSRFELGGIVNGFVHQTPVERLILHERTLLEREGDGWTATFGDTSERGLSLSVRVTRAN